MACWYPSPWWPRWDRADTSKETTKKASKPRKKAVNKKEVVPT